MLSARLTTTLSRNARHLTTTPPWATFNPDLASTQTQTVSNLVDGKWIAPTNGKVISIPNPMNDQYPALFVQSDTKTEELGPFVESLKKVSKSGLHNPLKNVSRYLMLGNVSRLAGDFLKSPEGNEYFAQIIMSCMPKSHAQAVGEVTVTADFLHNFSSDNVRFLAESTSTPGSHDGQSPTSYRWPYGPVMVIAPFNFPLEIPTLQLMGALYMGNKPVLKNGEKVSLVMEQFLRLLHECGLPKTDVDMLNSYGPVASDLIKLGGVRLTQFTGSSKVGEILANATNGKVKLEDAGFDWKILGPDVKSASYVAWQCDQDAYACSGQKCSATSMLFVHENWAAAGIYEMLKETAATRKLSNLTIGPVLTHTTEDILEHVNNLLALPGASVLFGGKELENHSIPKCYGAVEPTAVFVPIKAMMQSQETFDLCVREIFGPFQIVTEYCPSELPLVLEACEKMNAHLTAAVVSNDTNFQQTVLASTVNGTTYTGIRARTTGAPQNHWFGPAGDPRGAGIGTKDAIRLVWSCNREVIKDSIVEEDWVKPEAS